MTFAGTKSLPSVDKARFSLPNLNTKDQLSPLSIVPTHVPLSPQFKCELEMMLGKKPHAIKISRSMEYIKTYEEFDFTSSRNSNMKIEHHIKFEEHNKSKRSQSLQPNSDASASVLLSDIINSSQLKDLTSIRSQLKPENHLESTSGNTEFIDKSYTNNLSDSKFFREHPEQKPKMVKISSKVTLDKSKYFQKNSIISAKRNRILGSTYKEFLNNKVNEISKHKTSLVDSRDSSSERNRLHNESPSPLFNVYSNPCYETDEDFDQFAVRRSSMTQKSSDEVNYLSLDTSFYKSTSNETFEMVDLSNQLVPNDSSDRREKYGKSFGSSGDSSDTLSTVSGRTVIPKKSSVEIISPEYSFDCGQLSQSSSCKHPLLAAESCSSSECARLSPQEILVNTDENSNCVTNYDQPKYKPPLPPKPKFYPANLSITKNSPTTDHSNKSGREREGNVSALIKPPPEFYEPCHNVFCSYLDSPLTLRFDNILKNPKKIESTFVDTIGEEIQTKYEPTRKHSEHFDHFKEYLKIPPAKFFSLPRFDASEGLKEFLSHPKSFSYNNLRIHALSNPIPIATCWDANSVTSRDGSQSGKKDVNRKNHVTSRRSSKLTRENCIECSDCSDNNKNFHNKVKRRSHSDHTLNYSRKISVYADNSRRQSLSRLRNSEHFSGDEYKNQLCPSCAEEELKKTPNRSRRRLSGIVPLPDSSE